MVACGISAYLVTAEPPGLAQVGRPVPAVPVIVAPVEARVMTQRVDALGTVYANESVVITSKVTERIESIHFADGQPVRMGELLMQLNDQAILAQLEEARAELEESLRQLDRSRRLEDSGAIAVSTLDERLTRYNRARAQVALFEARLSDHRIVAPFDGVVGLRFVSPGEVVSPGRELAVIADVGRVKIDFTVPERWVGQVRPGMAVVGRSVAYPGEVFAGEVASQIGRAHV